MYFILFNEKRLQSVQQITSQTIIVIKHCSGT